MNAANASSPIDAFDIVVIGGGAAGITVAAEMRRHRGRLSVAIVEPSDTHAYQAGWTLVGAGVLRGSEFDIKHRERSFAQAA